MYLGAQKARRASGTNQELRRADKTIDSEICILQVMKNKAVIGAFRTPVQNQRGCARQEMSSGAQERRAQNLNLGTA